MALKTQQILSMIGAAVIIGIIGVYKDTLRAWFADPKPKAKAEADAKK